MKNSIKKHMKKLTELTKLTKKEKEEFIKEFEEIIDFSLCYNFDIKKRNWKKPRLLLLKDGTECDTFEDYIKWMEEQEK